MKEKYQISLAFLFVVFLIGVIILLIKYDSNSSSQSGYSSTSKIVSEKTTAIENEVSGIEILFGNGSITKSVTVYYLVAEDGTSCKVSMSEWNKSKIGSSYIGYWK